MIGKENIYFYKESTINRLTKIEIDGKNQIALESIKNITDLLSSQHIDNNNVSVLYIFAGFRIDDKENNEKGRVKNR